MKKQSTATATATATMETTDYNKQQHPLHQIATTPTHRLLLKQWLKESDLILHRISLKQLQIDSIRKELTTLYSLFFLMHSLSLLLLFTTSKPSPSSCSRSWIPSLCSLFCTLTLIWAIRYKNDVELHAKKLLKREEEDGELLGKCVEELKRKGVEFDLLKEVDALRRAKSLRVVERRDGEVGKWSGRDLVTMVFFGVGCLVLVMIRVVLCG